MRKYPLGLTLAGIAALLLTACSSGGGGGSSSGGAPNTAPTANAGANQTVASGATVTLNGTASSDPDGSIASYAWTQTAGTPNVTLANGTTAQPTFTAPNVAAAATLTFSLVVTDNRGAASSGASVSVTVNPSANVVPTANAGANQTATSGTTVTLNGTASTDPDGSIASFAWTQTAGTPLVTLASATTAQPTFVAPTVAAATALTFSLVVTDDRGATSAASTVTVNLTPAVAGNVNVTGKITFARVPFSSAPLGLNYAAPVQQPARGVVVRAFVPGSPNTLLNSTVTDSVGNYTLVVANNTNISVRVEAQMVRNGIPQWDVRVLDGFPSTNLYSYTEPGSFNSAAGAGHDIAIPSGINAAGAATGARASGPFAILDTIYQGIQTVLAAAPNTNFPALVVDWGSQNEGTFFTAGGGQHIALLADLAEDTDEFDQHVIAHEFGHYIEHNFSRADNIGGAHGIGDKLDIRVAFGEGFGYAFAAIVLDDPVARDSYVDDTLTRCGALQCSGQFNIEANPPNGTDDEACWCSESSVWSLLWDFYDANADANDTLAIGFGPLWNVLAGAQKDTPAFTSIFSFASALKAARPADAAAIDTLLAAQEITTAGIDACATTEIIAVPGVPAPATLPLYTDITVGAAAIVVATSDDAGRHNRLGNHRYFRFTPTASGNVNISVSSSNPTNPDPDFRVYQAGTPVLNAEDPPPQPETGTLAVTANTTYVLDVYDCANGCDTAQGTAGDYNLTVTIN